MGWIGKYGIAFRDDNGAALSTLRIKLIEVYTSAEIILRNSGPDKSYYYNSSVPDGWYNVYINDVKQDLLSPLCVDNKND